MTSTGSRNQGSAAAGTVNGIGCSPKGRGVHSPRGGWAHSPRGPVERKLLSQLNLESSLKDMYDIDMKDLCRNRIFSQTSYPNELKIDFESDVRKTPMVSAKFDTKEVVVEMDSQSPRPPKVMKQ